MAKRSRKAQSSRTTKAASTNKGAAAAKNAKGSTAPARATTSSAEMARHPLVTLRQEFDRLFEDLSSSFSLFPFGRRGLDIEPFRRRPTSLWTAMPAVDVIEKPKEFRLTAELPGMDERDIELTVTNDVITLKGEKKEEKEEKKKDYYVSERRYGSFQRSFRLPDGVSPEKIEARFQKGILTITLPKSKDGKTKERKISVRASSR